MRCWHPRWWLNLLYHNAGPDLLDFFFFFNKMIHRWTITSCGKDLKVVLKTDIYNHIPWNLADSQKTPVVAVWNEGSGWCKAEIHVEVMFHLPRLCLRLHLNRKVWSEAAFHALLALSYSTPRTALRTGSQEPMSITWSPTGSVMASLPFLARVSVSNWGFLVLVSK